MGVFSSRSSTRELSELLTSLLTLLREEQPPSLEQETLLLLASNPERLPRCPTSLPEEEHLLSFLRVRYFLELLLLLTSKCVQYFIIKCYDHLHTVVYIPKP